MFLKNNIVDKNFNLTKISYHDYNNNWRYEWIKIVLLLES